MHDRDLDEPETKGNLDPIIPADTEHQESMPESEGAEPRHREFTLEETFGSVTPIQRPEDFKELSRLAKEEKVARTLAELDQQSHE